MSGHRFVRPPGAPFIVPSFPKDGVCLRLNRLQESAWKGGADLGDTVVLGRFAYMDLVKESGGDFADKPVDENVATMFGFFRLTVDDTKDPYYIGCLRKPPTPEAGS